MTNMTKVHNLLTSKSKIRLSNTFLEESNLIVKKSKIFSKKKYWVKEEIKTIITH